MQTIVALATPHQVRGAVGIIRLSGADSLALAEAIFSPFGGKQLKNEPKTMLLGTVRAKNSNDKAFCVYHKAPFSYTGEDVVEVQFHGSLALQADILQTLVMLGARPAEPGEFTKRAFLNGKLTLDEAEGVCDLVNADGVAAANNAYRMMQGELSKKIRQAEERLVQASVNLEAILDYPEELEDDLKPLTKQLIVEVDEQLSRLLATSRERKLLTEGATVAIIGQTNVGKSSLLNSLAQQDLAIVTEIAGTTRDVLKERLELSGVRLTLLDTAGIRESQDVVENIGILRAREAAKQADLVLFVMDLTEEENHEERALRQEMDKEKTIFIANKEDVRIFERQGVDLEISAKTGRGLDKLSAAILSKLKLDTLGGGDAILTRERHIFAVQTAKDALVSALSNYENTTIDCLSLEIKTALNALASITGHDISEEIVDKIFATFCVGK